MGVLSGFEAGKASPSRPFRVQKPHGAESTIGIWSRPRAGLRTKTWRVEGHQNSGAVP